MLLHAASMIVAVALATGAMLSGESRADGAAVTRFLAIQAEPLSGYSAVRHLEAVARGGRMTASMTVRTTLNPARGFEFSVLAKSGSALIHRKVFLPALEAERQARTPAEAARGALTPDNYEFVAGDVNDEGLLRIDIRPRRADTLLVRGSILVTPEDADLVRIEGLLVKRPSFWTRRVEVVRRYLRLGGVRVPVAMHSTADVLIAGRSTFEMTYEYESINGQPVAAPISANLTISRSTQ